MRRRRGSSYAPTRVGSTQDDKSAAASMRAPRLSIPKRVRNVEVSVRDNDTPGVFVTEVAPDTNVEDRRTFVIEGGTFGADYTGRDDDLLIELAKEPHLGDVIVVRIELDAESQQAIQLFDKGSGGRFQQHTSGSSTYYTISFTQLDWDEDGQLVPWPAIEDAETVDDRRAEVGLPPLAEVLADRRRTAALEGDHPPADLAARRREADAWARAVGWRE